MKNPIWLLSGFLGDENHWGDFPHALAQHLGEAPQWLNWVDTVSGAEDLSGAAQCLLQRAYSEGTRPVLIGYSMGGRLALQCALEGPGTLSAVIALSAHPGLSLASERSLRHKADQSWATLLRDDWSSFWRQWNEQDSLKQTPPLSAPELSETQRHQWATLLTRLSTGAQDYLPSRLTDARLPVLWCAGSLDQKFASFQSCFPSNIETHLIAHAGHRLPLEAPTELARLLAPCIRRSQEIL